MKDIIKLAPVVLFVYNRPKHTKITVEALKKNKLAINSNLYIYSDAAKNSKVTESVNQVREYIKTVNGFNKITIIEREKNFGLANSIIDGVSNLVNELGKVIVLEDDLITSPYFLSFMNEALDFYQSSEKIYSITGFSFSTEFMNFPADFIDDVYLNIRPMSWGWATWKDEWAGIDWDVKNFKNFINSKKLRNDFDRGGTDLTSMLNAQMNGEIDSWYIRWSYNAFLKKKYTIYPKISFVNNIGHDRTGIHCAVDSKSILSHSEMNLSNNFKFEETPVLDARIISRFNKAFDVKPTIKVKRFIKKLLNYAQNH